jgi:hypothetical protein
MIQQQYGNLGGITSLGQNAAAMTGNAGQQMANNVGNLYNMQGQAQAGAYLNAGKQQGNMFNSINSGIGGAARQFGGSSNYGGFTDPADAVGSNYGDYTV